MASRRMVSNKIIDSARFIKMPISSQALYFHLVAKGDDDGVVEAFNVMRMIGATEDDLKVLVTKGFVVVLNEDLVSFITDWKEHNLIRADRKIDSIYKDLLLQIVPDAELLEKKTSYYQRKKELADICPTNGSIGKDSIGKNSIDKDSINTPAKAEPKQPKKSYGEYGRVKLTENQYKKLCEDFNKDFIDNQIMLLDEYVEGNNNKNKYSNFNLVLRKSIREGWFKKKENNVIQTKKEIVPDWFDKKPEIEPLSPEAQKRMEDLIKGLQG